MAATLTPTGPPEQHQRPKDTHQSSRQLAHSHLSQGPQVSLRSPPSPLLPAAHQPPRASLFLHINYSLSPLPEPSALRPLGLPSQRGQRSFSPLPSQASLRSFRPWVWNPAVRGATPTQPWSWQRETPKAPQPLLKTMPCCSQSELIGSLKCCIHIQFHVVVVFLNPLLVLQYLLCD